MEKWNKVSIARNDMPRDRVFISLWKGKRCLTEWSDDRGCYYIIWNPVEYWVASPVDSEGEKKFSYWIDMPSIPEEYWSN